jgi:hypothetical protein
MIDLGDCLKAAPSSRWSHGSSQPRIDLLRQQGEVDWHSHTNISDTIYILEGYMRLFLQDPKES